MNLFEHSVEWPYHLSVGVVLRNQSGEVLVHHWDRVQWEQREYTDLTYLIRETVEEGEVLEDAVARGLKEEAGARGEIRAFLGTIVARSVPSYAGTLFEKTTLYFLVDLVSFRPDERLMDDPESSSCLVWRKPEGLVDAMRAQRQRLGRNDVDESVILERVLAHGLDVK